MPIRVLVPAAAVVLVLAGGAFAAYDAFVAAGVLIGGVTLLAVAGLGADWEQHPSFEEREQARARKRKERWEATADARARDRARFEAYQARRAAKERSTPSG